MADSEDKMLPPFMHSEEFRLSPPDVGTRSPQAVGVAAGAIPLQVVRTGGGEPWFSAAVPVAALIADPG